MTTPTNTPWTVRNCGNPAHGPEWECHRVEDSTSRALLKSVTREVAERYASVPVLLEQLASAESRGYERAREQAQQIAATYIPRDMGYEEKQGATSAANDIWTNIRAMTDERAEVTP